MNPILPPHHESSQNSNFGAQQQQQQPPQQPPQQPQQVTSSNSASAMHVPQKMDATDTGMSGDPLLGVMHGGGSGSPAEGSTFHATKPPQPKAHEMTSMGTEPIGDPIAEAKREAERKHVSAHLQLDPAQPSAGSTSNSSGFVHEAKREEYDRPSGDPMLSSVNTAKAGSSMSTNELKPEEGDPRTGDPLLSASEKVHKVQDAVQPKGHTLKDPEDRDTPTGDPMASQAASLAKEKEEASKPTSKPKPKPKPKPTVEEGGGEEEEDSGTRRSSGRARKTVEAFVPDPIGHKPTKGSAKVEGVGTPLRDIGVVNTELSKQKSDELANLHRLLYAKPGAVRGRKADILDFSGYITNEPEADNDRKEKMHSRASRMTLQEVKYIMECLHLPRSLEGTSGTKDTLVNRLVDFLGKPNPEETTAPPQAKKGTKRKKASPKKKATSKKTKKKTSSSSSSSSRGKKSSSSGSSKGTGKDKPKESDKPPNAKKAKISDSDDVHTDEAVGDAKVEHYHEDIDNKMRSLVAQGTRTWGEMKASLIETFGTVRKEDINNMKPHLIKLISNQ